MAAYTGPVGLAIYLWSCREPFPGAHEAYVAPLWKQAVASTIHCVFMKVIMGGGYAAALRRTLFPE